MPTVADPSRSPTLFDEPPVHRARPSDPATSHAAARQLNPGKAIRRVVIAIAAAGDRGVTTDEVVARSGGDRGCTARRITDARCRGLVRDSGRDRLSRAKRPNIVWVATSTGQRLAANVIASEAEAS